MAQIDVYEMVTERIMEQLEKGIIPWHKDWHTGSNVAYNRISKNIYSPLNQMILARSGEYASFKQWTDLGGKIKKGAKSEIVVFWKMLPVSDTDHLDEDGNPTTKVIPFLRYNNVFHSSDVEGVEPLNIYDTDARTFDNDSIAEAEKIYTSYVAREQAKTNEHFKVGFGGNDAYYSPIRDFIQVPELEHFEHAESFYSTLFHEMVHSTGHRNRLARFEGVAKRASFGDENYSKEELVAEIGSACLVSFAGIETEYTFNNSTAYIQSWLKALKNDKKLIVSASSRAEKAVNYILGIETL